MEFNFCQEVESFSFSFFFVAQSSQTPAASGGTDIAEVVSLTIAGAAILAVILVAVVGWKAGYLPSCCKCGKDTNPYSQFDRRSTKRTSLTLSSLGRHRHNHGQCWRAHLSSAKCVYTCCIEGHQLIFHHDTNAEELADSIFRLNPKGALPNFVSLTRPKHHLKHHFYLGISLDISLKFLNISFLSFSMLWFVTSVTISNAILFCPPPPPPL